MKEKERDDEEEEEEDDDDDWPSETHRTPRPMRSSFAYSAVSTSPSAHLKVAGPCFLSFLQAPWRGRWRFRLTNENGEIQSINQSINQDGRVRTSYTSPFP